VATGYGSPGGSEPVIRPQEICGHIAMAVESGVVYPKFERLLVYGLVFL
jgi:hypothetical protein